MGGWSGGGGGGRGKGADGATEGRRRVDEGVTEGRQKGEQGQASLNKCELALFGLLFLIFSKLRGTNVN